MSQSYRTPPPWEDGIPFETWKAEVDVWELVTDLPTTKRAPAVALSLTKRKREVALEIPIDTLKETTGMTSLMEKLKAVFAKEGADRAYELYSKFEQMRRGDKSVGDYIQDFQRAYHQIQILDMKLPTNVLACKLLCGADLSARDRQLVLSATPKLEFDEMESTLRRIFSAVPVSGVVTTESTTDSTCQPSRTTLIKEESAFVTNTSDDNVSQESGSAFWTGRGNKKRNTRRGFSSRGGGAPARVRGTNPLDSEGRISKCVVCGSRFHWAKDCPDQEKKDSGPPKKSRQGEADESTGPMYLMFLSNSERLTNECFGRAVLDTACTMTVTGSSWLNDYIQRLPQILRQQVTTYTTEATIVFGDGRRMASVKSVSFPVSFGSLNCHIKAEVIDAAIPLLLSVKSMKNALFVIDLKEQNVRVNANKAIPCTTTSTGHISINILPQDCTKTSYAWIATDIFDEKSVGKLHAQFGHCSSEKLKTLIKNSGKHQVDNKLIDSVVSNCQTCAKFGRAKPRPVAGLPLATEFNEVVSLDLHEISHSYYYIHLIDQFTRFSAAGVIRSKDPEVIIKEVIVRWCFVFGTPKAILTDNGGEFDNDKFRSMCENFNICIKSTAAESPFSNGVCERHNAVVTEMFEKVRLSSGLDDQTALTCAVFAKNCLHNNSGYSPYQLVYGRNPNLPGVIENKLPALQNVTTSSNLQTLLEALHSARQSFLQAESSQRIAVALRHNIRSYSHTFEVGQDVFYKRKDSDRWRGPGRIIGVDGRVFIVRQGGFVNRVHGTHLRISGSSDWRYPVPATSQAGDSTTTSQQPIDCEQTMDKDYVQNEQNDIDFPEDSLPEEEDHQEPENGADNEVSYSETAQAQNGLEQLNTQELTTVNRGWPKKNDYIRFIYRNTDDTSVTDPFCEAKVISRAGKVGGKHQSWFNIEYVKPYDMAGETKCVNLNSDSYDWEVLPSSEVCFMLSDETQNNKFDQPKQQQLEEWRRHRVFQEVQDVGQAAISTRWICTTKTDGSLKARLVARGFEDPELPNLVKDSPTCSRESFRIILAIAASQRPWACGSIDIRSAFLQGTDMRRTVHVMPPPEALVEGVIWRLNKCVFGLADAPRHWYENVKKELVSVGCFVSQFDGCVFAKHDGCTLIGLIIVHVDDFFWAGTTEFEKLVVGHLSKVFEVGTTCSLPLRYLGLSLEDENGKYVVDQSHYVKKIQEIEVEKGSTKDSKLNEKERSKLRAALGKVLWVSGQTRPDMSFIVSFLISRLPVATQEDLLVCNKQIRKLHADSSNCRIVFPDMGSIDKWQLLVFSDASLNNCDDGNTQGGYIVFLSNGTQCCPLSWKSGKLKRITRSTLCSEALAFVEGLDTAYLFQKLLDELLKIQVSITCFTDNNSLVDAIYSTKLVADKRLRVELGYIRQMVMKGDVSKVVWVPSGEQLADCMTKNTRKTILNEVLKSQKLQKEY